MKIQKPKKLFAFIIAIMMFSVIPETTNAQNKVCTDGQCPNGFTCVDGFCVKIKSGGGGGYHCPGRPTPWCCWLMNSTAANESLSVSSANSNAISFELIVAQNVSAKISDATGRLVKTFADKIFEQGEHKLQWDAAGVNAGVYIVQFNTGSYRETKKNSVIK